MTILNRTEIEASFLQSGERLLFLDDRAWQIQILLHEVRNDTLTKALWYLKPPPYFLVLWPALIH